jgi:hypothetical protein
MFPSALAISAPIPFVFDLTLTFGPALLLIVLALLDLSAVALLHAALVANRSQRQRAEWAPLAPRPRRSDAPHASAPPSRAA